MLKQSHIEALEFRIGNSRPGTIVPMTPEEMRYIKSIQGKNCPKCDHMDAFIDKDANPGCYGCNLYSKFSDKKQQLKAKVAEENERASRSNFWEYARKEHELISGSALGDKSPQKLIREHTTSKLDEYMKLFGREVIKDMYRTGIFSDRRVVEGATAPVVDGSAKSSTHYMAGAIQPIEFMQANLTPEEFKGFLKGNVLKYTARCGKKDATVKDMAKIVQYSQWLLQAERGETINPRV